MFSLLSSAFDFFCFVLDIPFSFSLAHFLFNDHENACGVFCTTYFFLVITLYLFWNTACSVR